MIRLVCVCLLIFVVSAFSENEVELEIERLKDEVAQYESKIEQLDERIELQQKRSSIQQLSHQEYVTHYEQRMNSSVSQHDSLANITRSSDATHDSLISRLEYIELLISSEERKSGRYRTLLVDQCDTLLAFLNQYPENAIGSYTGRVQYLKSELRDQDATVGMSRVISLIKEISFAADECSVIQGEAPVDHTAESGWYVQIGFSYFAFINEVASRGAIWNSETRNWDSINSEESLELLQKTAEIGRGKSVPALAFIPLIEQLNSNDEGEESEDE